MFKMKEEYKTGIDFIDKQHEEIFNIADKTYTLLKSNYNLDKFDEISELINELKEYSKFHFKAEEEYMEKIGYKKLFNQKIEHLKFIDAIEELNLENIDKEQDKYILKILKFLNDWLVNHILEKDILIDKN